MKLDGTKILIAVIVLFGSLISYIGTDIIFRLNRLETSMDRSIKAGALDMVADYLADQDSLSASDYELLEHILIEGSK